ncbi:hypothetical protein CTA2_4348 [Colletotrichum tanaceti]|uniref:Uncharacterized protein n=1 Tax=Colletotrichum tanaceti TaxID=1306861 RepID=A0A4V6DFI3_9PEZI|nr:hypothetical protein CTA2_4348 [Colletotrichum tanaceti]TKW49286.1 hypothetical protein CTA1_9213 [Colletotrichum tanaceti]
MGILSGEGFEFHVKHSGDVVATSLTASSKSRRGLPVTNGLFIESEAVKTPLGAQCPSSDQRAMNKTPSIPFTTNGCGVEGFEYLVPDLKFADACHFHDACWTDCSRNFSSCNTEFLNRMNSKCDEKYKPGTRRGVCRRLAKVYHRAVNRRAGKLVFSRVVERFCDCTCKDPNLTMCRGRCVDTRKDTNNCGKCNYHCTSGACANGTCLFNYCPGRNCPSFVAKRARIDYAP